MHSSMCLFIMPGMLMAVSYTPREGRTPEDRRRVRQLFIAWTPPPGLELLAHYHFVNGGGVLIVVADSVDGLYRSIEPFKPMVNFDIEPVINVMEAIATSMDVDEWVTTVLGEGNR
jgi:hypothetical protein